MRARDVGNCRCIPIYYANSAARLRSKGWEGLLHRSGGQASDEVSLEAEEDQKRDREADE